MIVDTVRSTFNMKSYNTDVIKPHPSLKKNIDCKLAIWTVN